MSWEWLTRGSSVFKDMLLIADGSGHNADEPIQIDAPADAVCLFLDLLTFPFDLSTRTPVTSSAKQILLVLHLADKLGANTISEYMERQLNALDPWEVLKYANETDDIPLAKKAIARLPLNGCSVKWFDKDNELSTAMRGLTLEWQLALLHCLVPYMARGKSHERSMVIQSLDKAAQHFQP